MAITIWLNYSVKTEHETCFQSEIKECKSVNVFFYGNINFVRCQCNIVTQYDVLSDT